MVCFFVRRDLWAVVVLDVIRLPLTEPSATVVAASLGAIACLASGPASNWAELSGLGACHGTCMLGYAAI